LITRYRIGGREGRGGKERGGLVNVQVQITVLRFPLVLVGEERMWLVASG